MADRPKTAFGDAPRGTVFYLDPLPPSRGGQITYVGYDTEDDRDHILYSKTARNNKPNVGMAQDIDELGVHTPAIVRKNGPTAEIIFGRRRLLGIRLANEWRAERGDELRKLPCTKFQGTDAQLLELIISENAHREDEDPIERARQAMRLLQFRPKSAVARAANVSVATLAHWERVLDASPKVQEAVREKALAWGAASELVDLPFEQQEKQLADLIEAHKVNGVKPTTREVIRRVNPDKVTRPGQKDLRKTLEALKDGTLEDPGGETLIRWIIGEIQTTRIKGLSKVLG